MPAITFDSPLVQYDGASLVVSLNPTAVISGQTYVFQAQKRFGGVSGIVLRSVASGFNGVSGITVTDGLHGVMAIALQASDFSGQPGITFAFTTNRTDSGFHTNINNGYFWLTPGSLP